MLFTEFSSATEQAKQQKPTNFGRSQQFPRCMRSLKTLRACFAVQLNTKMRFKFDFLFIRLSAMRRHEEIQRAREIPEGGIFCKRFFFLFHLKILITDLCECQLRLGVGEFSTPTRKRAR